MRRLLSRSILAVAVTSFAVFAADNSLGTWKLNLEKSTYSPRPIPVKSLTITREAADGRVKVTTSGERTDGTPISISYTTKYDGRPDR